MASKQTPQLALDGAELQRRIHQQGYASVQEFADRLGLHRNTIGNYLSGKTSLPSALARILDALDTAPADVLYLSRSRKAVPGLAIIDLVDQLHSDEPDAAFVLFGSRARGSAKPLSDYDIGVYASSPLGFAAYSRLLDRVADWNDSSISHAQLVDLNRAGSSFLAGIVDDLKFLAGSPAPWRDLLIEAGVQPHE